MDSLVLDRKTVAEGSKTFISLLTWAVTEMRDGSRPKASRIFKVAMRYGSLLEGVSLEDLYPKGKQPYTKGAGLSLGNSLYMDRYNV